MPTAEQLVSQMQQNYGKMPVQGLGGLMDANNPLYQLGEKIGREASDSEEAVKQYLTQFGKETYNTGERLGANLFDFGTNLGAGLQQGVSSLMGEQPQYQGVDPQVARYRQIIQQLQASGVPPEELERIKRQIGLGMQNYGSQ